MVNCTVGPTNRLVFALGAAGPVETLCFLARSSNRYKTNVPAYVPCYKSPVTILQWILCVIYGFSQKLCSKSQTNCLYGCQISV